MQPTQMVPNERLCKSLVYRAGKLFNRPRTDRKALRAAQTVSAASRTLPPECGMSAKDLLEKLKRRNILVSFGSMLRRSSPGERWEMDDSDLSEDE
jgi:hypothetical protein